MKTKELVRLEKGVPDTKKTFGFQKMLGNSLVDAEVVASQVQLHAVSVI
jgi:hypothetical protein